MHAGSILAEGGPMRILIAAAAFAATVQPALAQQAPPVALPLDGTLLEVVAEGKTTRVPDVATIRAGVVTQGANAAEALRQNADRMAGVLAALERAGVARRDVQTASISLQPQYRYGENVPPVITGYQASNSVAVRFRDIARSGAILDALVKEGANQIDGPSLAIDQPEAALDEARTDAVRRARARAQVYAAAAGLRVERILSIGEGSTPGAYPPMPVLQRMEAKADTAILPGEQDVGVTVTVRFLLK
jgi:uncharacterized protein YggE